jgi:hypothetical protein
MCQTCLSTGEAVATFAVFTTYVVKPPVHRALARAGLAPDPDPVAHDVRTVAFLQALDLDPVTVLGRDVVDQASAWTPSSSWVPWRERLARKRASAAPIGSQSLITAT